MLRRRIYTAFAFSIVCSVAFAQVGNKCIVKLTGDEGECKVSSDCPVVEEQARQRLSITICGFQHMITPIVCCPRDSFSQPELEPDPLIFPSDEPPSVVLSNDNLRISERKCEEYSKAITGVVQAIALVPQTVPINISVEKCDYNSVPLIVGGKPASAGEFPFMTAIGFNSSEQQWRCGGTLISGRYVLTAAHCTFTRDAGRPSIVRFGDIDLTTSSDGSEHKDYRVANIVVHPEYRYPEKYHDIALIQTATRVEFTKFIRPACLYTSSDIPEEMATATGWGRTDFAAESSDILMKVTLNIYENSQCTRTYQNNRELPQGITESMMCAGELKGGKDTCQGDSGGPLLITKPGNRCKFYVIGVTSFGKSCGQKNTPAVYTKVSNYIEWIERTIW